MPKINYEAIDKDLAKTRDVVMKASTVRGSVDEKLAKVLQGAKMTEIKVDLDDADFTAVRTNETALQTNIATLIFGLDEITKTFGTEFKTMSEKTTGEKIMGFLSHKKSEEMRTSRIKGTDIRGNLTQLIKKSEIISAILEDQKAVLQDRLGKTIEGQTKILDRSKATAGDIVSLNEKLDTLGPKIAGFDQKLAEATGEARKDIEKQRAETVNEYNEATAQLQSKTAEQQSLERYASQFANYVESLTRQKAAQETMIQKLRLDTEQRVILYESLVESLRTTQQQDIAHRIDDAGRETDAQAEEMMLQAGVSASNRIVNMMETHKVYMQRTEEVARKGKIAQADFERRFADIMKNVDTGRYSEGETA